MLENNIKIAKFLGWTYYPHNNCPEGFKPGWYSKIPTVKLDKITSSYYIGRSHNSLDFHTNMNRMIKVVEYLQKSLGYSLFIYDVSLVYNVIISKQGKHLDSSQYNSYRELYYNTIIKIIDLHGNQK